MIQILPTKLAQLVRLYQMINRHHKHFLKNIVVIIDTVLNFIRSHPLMDSAVAHQDDKPVFYKRDLLFTHLVVDKLKYDVFGDQMEYTVFYAGTSKSPLLYMYVEYSHSGGIISANSRHVHLFQSPLLGSIHSCTIFL